MNKPLRGFQLLTPEQRHAIASSGGRKAQASGTAHRLSGDKAREAGRIGGKKISQNREHMASIGRRGAIRKRENRLQAKAAVPA